MLTRAKVYRKLSKDIIIWVDPKDIDDYIGKNVPFLNTTNRKLRKIPQT